jgi:hypothetical protein
LLPAGETGEIVVRGPEVFAGYENDPEANRRIFHDGWCRTGDLGYLDRDGYLFLCGRVKEIINRGGYKVSPPEVDAALASHPQVTEAGTFAVPHPTLGEDVVAAVVLRAPGAATPQELRDFAFAELAAFKVPSRIVPVAEIPKTALGKIRRSELAALLAVPAPRELLPACGPNEALVARLFAEVLGVDAIGALDDFFELGGDSLRGTQVVARANAALGTDLPPTCLFRRPTVRGFAAELAAAADSGHGSGPPPIRPRTHARLDLRAPDRQPED